MENLSTKNSKFNIENIAIAIFIIGCLVRILFIGQIPTGLNQDEASNAYEAFAILNYGIDRNGIKNPIHLIAWGSGQNIAYTWLCMPFIKLFGLNTITTRIPMAIIGCISIYVFYIFLKELFNKKYALIGTIYFSLFPWHIMKSRWGLDCNIFPDLILWGTTLVLLFIKRQEKKYLYLSILTFAFSFYSYGTSYMFIPLFLGGVWIYMFVNKKITIKDFILSTILFLILIIPILVFIIINLFDLPQMQFLGFTIPRMVENRFFVIMNSDGQPNLLANCFNNLISVFQTIIFQGDGLPWNGMDWLGICYTLFVPFFLIGPFISIKNKTENEFLINWWFICSIILAASILSNVNRINIIFIPVAYYIVRGIMFFINNRPQSSFVIFPALALCFIIFVGNYFTYHNQILGYYFDDGYGQALKVATQDVNSEKIYALPTSETHQLYMLTLFFEEISPKTYLETREIVDTNSNFQAVTKFDKYYFSFPEKINPTENASYIALIGNEHLFNKNEFEIKTFENYFVAYPKNLFNDNYTMW